MSFLSPKSNLPSDLTNAKPGRQVTFTPSRPVPGVLGRGKCVVNWETPILHWKFVNTKTTSTAFFSGFGSIALGPVDRIISLSIGEKYYQGIFQDRASNPGDFLQFTRSGPTPTRFWFWWGYENHANYGAYIDALIKDPTHPLKGRPHSAHFGIFTMAVEDFEAGDASSGQTPAIPEIVVEFYRRSPTAYSFGAPEHGTHPVGMVWDILKLKRGFLGLPDRFFDATHVTASMQRVMDVGVAGITGFDLFISLVFAEARDALDQIEMILEHLDAWLIERNGKLYIDWSSSDASSGDPTGLREISLHEMDDANGPALEPEGLEGLATRILVTCLNYQLDPSLSEDSAVANVPYARRVLGEARPTLQLQRRGFVTVWQAKAYADMTAAVRSNPTLRCRVKVKRQYAYQPDGVTPLRPGDRVTLDWAPFGLDVVMRILERSSENEVSVTFYMQRERGAYVRPYQPPIDPRASIDTPPPADLVRYAVAQLPPEISDVDDTYVAPLVERPSTRTVGYQVQFSPTNTWPGQTIEQGATRWAVAAVLGTTLTASFTATTISVGTVGLDWSTLVSQSVLEAGDDQLLLWHGGEWFSVGTITPTGGGNYTLAVLRARLGSLPAAHASGAIVFLQYRRELVTLTHADFANVEVAGAYHVTTATKWFKLRPYNSAAQGNLTTAFSAVLRDPTPAAPTAVAVAAPGGALLVVSWTQPAGALVNEWKVFRATGPSYLDEAEIAEVGERQYSDVGVIVGTTYRYRLKAVTTDENVSAFSGSATGTPTAPSTAVDSTPPSDPAAPSLAGSGTYQTDDGATKVWLDLTIAALPSGARVQTLLFRRSGTTHDYRVAGQYTNTGTITARVDDLEPGVNYDFAMRAHSSFGVPSAVVVATGIPFSANDSTPPAAPSGISALAGTGKSVKIGWAPNSEPDVQEYAVYRHTSNSPGAASKIAEVGGTSYLDNNVALGTTYWYWVTAVDRSENESAKSTGASATPAVVPESQIDTTPPSAAGTASLNSAGVYQASDGATLAWIRVSVPALPSGAVIQNVLYRRTGGSEYQVAAQVRNLGTTVVEVDDLAPGVSYDFALQAFSFTGYGTAVAAGFTTTTPGDSTAPATPTGISALAGTGKSVKVGWAANTEDDLSEYAIYRHTSNLPGAASKIAEVTGTSYHDNNVALGTTYWYWVTAIDRSENESAKSIGAAATPTLVPGSEIDNTAPSAPGAITLNATGTYVASDGSVFAYLELVVPALPVGAVVQNVLYRRTPGGIIDQVGAQLTNASANYLRLDDLSPGQAYEISLQAFSFSGAPSAITPASGSPFTAPSKGTAPAAPSGITAIAGDTGERPPPAVSGSDVMYVCWVYWTAPADKDVAFYEWCLAPAPGGDSEADTTFAAHPNNAKRTTERRVAVYSTLFGTQFFKIRSVDRTGNRGAWAAGLDLATYLRLPAGDLVPLSANNISKAVQVNPGGTPGLEVTAAGHTKFKQEFLDPNGDRVVAARKAAVASASTSAATDAPNDASTTYSIGGSDTVDEWTVRSALEDHSTRINDLGDRLNALAAIVNANGAKQNDTRDRLKTTGGHGLIAD